jgi:hypothetical protein
VTSEENNGIKSFLLGQFSGLAEAVSSMRSDIGVCREKAEQNGLELRDVRVEVRRYREDSANDIRSLRGEIMDLNAKYKARLSLWTGISIAMVLVATAMAKMLLG